MDKKVSEMLSSYTDCSKSVGGSMQICVQFSCTGTCIKEVFALNVTCPFCVPHSLFCFQKTKGANIPVGWGFELYANNTSWFPFMGAWKCNISVFGVEEVICTLVRFFLLEDVSISALHLSLMNINRRFLGTPIELWCVTFSATDIGLESLGHDVRQMMCDVWQKWKMTVCKCLI